MSVHWKIEKFLRASEMSASRFGRLAAGDPRLVHDMRNGREVGPRLRARLEAFLTEQGTGR